MDVVSLFSGIGGLDKGFINSGYNVVWANDFDNYACQTYAENFCHSIVNVNAETDWQNLPDRPIMCGDINLIPLESIPRHDILIGGFPCQPFSMMGEQRGFADTRGTLFFRIAEIINYQVQRNIEPRVIVLENVRRLLTHDNKRTFYTIKRSLENLGYKVFYKVLNSVDFGVPQVRNRVFIVCFRNENVNYEFPTCYHWDDPQLDVLAHDMHDILDLNVDERFYLSDRVRPTILSNGTGGYVGRSEINQSPARPLCATMAKMHRACQDNYYSDDYILGEGNTERIRKLTPRECARLQGFDDGFEIVVSNAQAYKQFGNAVTVNVAQAVAQSIKEKLNELGEWID